MNIPFCTTVMATSIDEVVRKLSEKHNGGEVTGMMVSKLKEGVTFEVLPSEEQDSFYRAELSSVLNETDVFSYLKTSNDWAKYDEYAVMCQNMFSIYSSLTNDTSVEGFLNLISKNVGCGGLTPELFKEVLNNSVDSFKSEFDRQRFVSLRFK